MSERSLPGWMVALLWLTTALNLFGAAIFAPLSSFGYELGGYPTPIHPIYAWTIAVFIGGFGVGYGRCAYRRQAPRFFIAIGAAGKLAFFAILVSYWALGEIPFKGVTAASADLWLGLAFAYWSLRPGE